MLVKNILVRRGVAFLEPNCVVLKGHRNMDLEAHQEFRFAKGLRERLG
jgi:RecQ-mediated genome instability protein 1